MVKFRPMLERLDERVNPYVVRTWIGTGANPAAFSAADNWQGGNVAVAGDGIKVANAATPDLPLGLNDVPELEMPQNWTGKVTPGMDVRVGYLKGYGGTWNNAGHTLDIYSLGVFGARNFTGTITSALNVKGDVDIDTGAATAHYSFASYIHDGSNVTVSGQDTLVVNRMEHLGDNPDNDPVLIAAGGKLEFTPWKTGDGFFSSTGFGGYAEGTIWIDGTSAKITVTKGGNSYFPVGNSVIDVTGGAVVEMLDESGLHVTGWSLAHQNDGEFTDHVGIYVEGDFSAIWLKDRASLTSTQEVQMIGGSSVHAFLYFSQTLNVPCTATFNSHLWTSYTNVSATSGIQAISSTGDWKFTNGYNLYVSIDMNSHAAPTFTMNSITFVNNGVGMDHVLYISTYGAYDGMSDDIIVAGSRTGNFGWVSGVPWTVGVWDTSAGWSGGGTGSTFWFLCN